MVVKDGLDSFNIKIISLNILYINTHLGRNHHKRKNPILNNSINNINNMKSNKLISKVNCQEKILQINQLLLDHFKKSKAKLKYNKS